MIISRWNMCGRKNVYRGVLLCREDIESYAKMIVQEADKMGCLYCARCKGWWKNVKVHCTGPNNCRLECKGCKRKHFLEIPNF